jgi:excisionase family DNA binding protein
MTAATEEIKAEKPKIPEVPLAQRLALTLAECCALTGLKMYQLRFAIRDGEISFIQNGKRGQYIVRREALDKYLRATEQREAR